jgi:hypothetical protein
LNVVVDAKLGVKQLHFGKIKKKLENKNATKVIKPKMSSLNFSKRSRILEEKKFPSVKNFQPVWLLSKSHQFKSDKAWKHFSTISQFFILTIFLFLIFVMEIIYVLFHLQAKKKTKTFITVIV